MPWWARPASAAPASCPNSRRAHHVEAIVCRHRELASSAAEQVLADAHDLPSPTTAFAGTDAVVSAFNPGWTAPGLYEKFMLGSRNVQRAAKDAHVERLLVVGGSGSLHGPDGRRLIEDMTIPEPYEAGVRAARDYHSEILGEAGLDWVFISPPPGYGPMGPTNRRGTHRTALDTPAIDEHGESTISGPDLALAIVDELENPRHHRRRFTVGYRCAGPSRTYLYLDTVGK